MKSFPFIVPAALMVLSWGCGLYFTSLLFTPTMIIPFFDQYLWISVSKGFLGLPLALTLITVPLLMFMYKTGSRSGKRYLLTGANALLWLAIIGVQTKLILYNLGICH